MQQSPPSSLAWKQSDLNQLKNAVKGFFSMLSYLSPEIQFQMYYLIMSHPFLKCKPNLEQRTEQREAFLLPLSIK